MGDKALPRVLVCEPLHQDALDLLAANARVDVRTGLSRDELLDIVDAYDALVVRSKTQVSGDVIEAGINLRVIARAGIGVDNIDVDAATEHGIAVVNAAGASAQSVAELTLGLILALLRHIPTADRTMKAGQWEKPRLIGRQLGGLTVGVVGYGRIGREVARLVAAFGTRVLVATNNNHTYPQHGEPVPFDRLLGESDIVTLHKRLERATECLIDADAIAKMKDGAYLVNTARGALVDERALLDALNSGKLAGAALDVFAQEPPGATALVVHPRVICTPHLGASTVEAQRAVGIVAVKSLLAVLKGQQPETIVNRQVV